MFIVTDYKKAKSPIGAASLTQPILCAPVLLLLAGCSTVGIEQQRLLSKPNMQFNEVRAFADPTRIASQLEPGRVVTGGAQASVCASCR